MSQRSRGVLADIRRAGEALEIDWADVPDDSAADGATIRSLAIRTRTGALVVAAIRGGEVKANPGPEYTIASGDMLAFLGTLEQREAARALVEEATQPTQGLA